MVRQVILEENFWRKNKNDFCAVFATSKKTSRKRSQEFMQSS